MKSKEYQIDEQQCSKMIKGVCRQCGGSLAPIETVDNSNQPTFWVGCKECCIFNNGTSIEVYEAARKLFDEKRQIYYTHIDRPDSSERTNTEEYKKYYRHSQISGLVYMVNEVISVLPASQQQPAGMRWVKASERLPGYDIPVLWISKDGNQFVEMLDKDGNDWLYNLELSDESVTHWMPLPAPPSESSPASDEG